MSKNKNCYKKANIKNDRAANGRFVSKNVQKKDCAVEVRKEAVAKADPFVSIRDIIEDGIMSLRQAMYDYEHKPTISRKMAKQMLKECEARTIKVAFKKAKWRVRLAFIYGMCFPAAFYAGWHYLYPIIVK